jgi:acetyl esterase
MRDHPKSADGSPTFEALLRAVEAQVDNATVLAEADTTAALVSADPALANVETRDLEITGRLGPVPARLYREPGRQARSALVWVHGGAFIGGDLDMPEANWVALAMAAHGIPVVSLDYRKALRGVAFPVPSDDVLAGWTWAVTHADDIGVVPAAVHLGGASAGGNLVAGATMRLRDSAGIMPCSLILVYPIVHASLPEDPDVIARAAKLPSSERWSRDTVYAMNMNFAGDDITNPYAFPALGAAHGLPPTYVLNSDIDDLRASGQAYGAKIALAGGTARIEFEPGSTHGHLNRPALPHARRSIRRIVQWIENETQLAEAPTQLLSKPDLVIREHS